MCIRGRLGRLGTLVASLVFFTTYSTAQEKSSSPKWDWEAEVQAENRYFLREGAYTGQERNFLSLAAQPEFEVRWPKGKHRIKGSFFGRWDQFDDNRTHVDIRELYYQRVKGPLEVSVGLKKVFWGVTESAHLIDIINQTDQVESFDGEQKLGQPMVQGSFLTRLGTFDLFYLPYARRRQFPAEKGRLRFPQVVEREDIDFDHDLEAWHPSLAARWSHYLGPFDAGLSYFYGVGREPLFLDLNTANPRFFYPIIHQAGVDLQATTGPILWKLETSYRYADEQDFTALAAGLEYTFGNVASTGMDISLLGEYLYDSRDELAISNLANDVFSGIRVAFNDVQSTEFLAGAVIDLENTTQLFSVETSRRFRQSWKAELEARFFEQVDRAEFVAFFERDSFLRIRISKYW